MTSGPDAASGGWTGAFVRHGGLLMGSNGVQSLVGFAAQLVLMRLLTPSDFGGFALILATAALVQVVASRLGVLAIRATEAELTDDYRHCLYSAMTIEALVSLVLMISWLALLGVDSLWSYPLAASLALGHWVNSATMFYERDMPYRPIARIETGTQLAAHGLSVVLALGGAGAASLYLREITAVLLRAFLMARVGAFPKLPVRLVTWAEWRALLAEARMPWLDGIVDNGFQRLTILAAGGLAGVHGAGLFSQAWRLALVPHQFLSPIVTRLAGNVFSRIEDEADRRRSLRQAVMVVALPLAMAAVAAWIWAEPVVPWLFGEDWRDAGPVLAAMAGMVLGFSLFELCRSYAMAQKLNGLMMTARLIQYGVFGLGCLVIAGSASAEALGAVMSVVFLASAATLLIGLKWPRGRR